MKPVVARRPDGLGTRLLSILYGLRFCEQLDSTLSIDWPSLSDLNYSADSQLLQNQDIGDIFEINRPIKDRADVSFIDSLSDSSLQRCMISGARNDIAGISREEIVEKISAFDLVVYDLAEPLLMAGMDSASELAIAKNNWQRINFSQEVVDSFKVFSTVNQLSESVAVHLRRGDLIHKVRHESIENLLKSGATQTFQRYVPLRTVAGILNKDFSDVSSCVVCSESEDAAADLQALVPNIRVVQSSTAYAKNSNQRALLDLLILSGSSQLISPFMSYFSTCAATVGRCQLVNAGLDIPHLIDELMVLLDGVDVPDLNLRKCIIYSYGYLNLWYVPDSEYRRTLFHLAMSADSEMCKRVLNI